MKWSKDSWKKYEAKQMPTYSDSEKLNQVVNNLSNLPPLIFRWGDPISKNSYPSSPTRQCILFTRRRLR